MNSAFKWILALVIGALTVYSFLLPPAALFPEPQLARILFFHLPCAIVCSLFFYAGAYMSLRVLIDKKLEWDARAAAANEVGFLLALLTMVTGILFSKVQWGQYWSWDPRQTSFLFVLLIYGAYFILRANFADRQKRATVSAAYAVSAILPATFCIFILPRIIFSLHPSDTITSGKLEGPYRWTYMMVLCFLFLCTWIYRLAVRAGILELRTLETYADVANRGGNPAPTGVVRNVSLHEESGTADRAG